MLSRAVSCQQRLAWDITAFLQVLPTTDGRLVGRRGLDLADHGILVVCRLVDAGVTDEVDQDPHPLNPCQLFPRGVLRRSQVKALPLRQPLPVVPDVELKVRSPHTARADSLADEEVIFVGEHRAVQHIVRLLVLLDLLSAKSHVHEFHEDL